MSHTTKGFEPFTSGIGAIVVAADETCVCALLRRLSGLAVCCNLWAFGLDASFPCDDFQSRSAENAPPEKKGLPSPPGVGASSTRAAGRLWVVRGTGRRGGSPGNMIPWPGVPWIHSVGEGAAGAATGWFGGCQVDPRKRTSNPRAIEFPNPQKQNGEKNRKIF